MLTQFVNKLFLFVLLFLDSDLFHASHACQVYKLLLQFRLDLAKLDFIFTLYFVFILGLLLLVLQPILPLNINFSFLGKCDSF
jgi:hypothetical protein